MNDAVATVEEAGRQAAIAGMPRRPPYDNRGAQWAKNAWLRGYDKAKVKK